MAKKVRKREEELNRNNPERIKMEERGGLKVKDMLGIQKNFKKPNCTQKTCPMCTKSDFIEITYMKKQIFHVILTMLAINGRVRHVGN